MGPFVIGSTYKLVFNLYRDGTPWDLTVATVQVVLAKPDGTQLTKTAAIQAPATAGVVYYVTLTTDFDTAGTWTLTPKVQDGGVVQESPPIAFTVVDSP